MCPRPVQTATWQGLRQKGAHDAGLIAHEHRTRDDVEVVSDEEPVVQVVQRAGLQVADGVFSDDEEAEGSLASSGLPATTASTAPKRSRADKKADILKDVESNLRKDWKGHWKNYQEHAAKIPWKIVPGVVVPADGRQLIWKDLWGADMGVVMREYFFKVDPDGSKFGHLPKMALASKGMMGALMAASFCERVNSCANLVVTEGNSLLSTDEIDMLVVLRMNKVFIGFMRQNYPEVIESVHAKYGSVIRVEDCVEEEYEDEQPASIDME
jgi:hypothetical protein